MNAGWTCRRGLRPLAPSVRRLSTGLPFTRGVSHPAKSGVHQALHLFEVIGRPLGADHPQLVEEHYERCSRDLVGGGYLRRRDQRSGESAVERCERLVSVEVAQDEGASAGVACRRPQSWDHFVADHASRRCEQQQLSFSRPPYRGGGPVYVFRVEYRRRLIESWALRVDLQCASSAETQMQSAYLAGECNNDHRQRTYQ